MEGRQWLYRMRGYCWTARTEVLKIGGTSPGRFFGLGFPDHTSVIENDSIPLFSAKDGGSLKPSDLGSIVPLQELLSVRQVQLLKSHQEKTSFADVGLLKELLILVQALVTLCKCNILTRSLREIGELPLGLVIIKQTHFLRLLCSFKLPLM